MIDYKTLLANYLRGCPKSLVFRGRIASHTPLSRTLPLQQYPKTTDYQ